ncbi:MAG: beta-lactamase family protein [Clostridia bacterium]|nr:beta-lactamase family protein [Clostridia bacterium]
MTPRASLDRQRLQREIEDITRRYQEAGYFPSACVRVFSAEETLASCCVGDAREDALFDVASLTKLATTAQVLRLISAGKLSLSQEAADCLPGIAGNAYLRDRLRGVTLRRLLTHTSSLVDWYPFYSLGETDFYDALAYVLRHTEKTEGVVYSDLNFMLLGLIIRQAQGKPLERCLREDLAEPLCLGRMTYLPDPALPLIPVSFGNPIETRMCRDRGIAFDGFRPPDQPVRGQANDGNSWYYFHGVAGHAGIFAEAGAYERLCQYWMRSADPLFREAQKEQPGAPGRGLGLQTGISYPHGCGHTGFTGTGVYFSTEYDVGVVSFTNRLFYRRENPNAAWEYRRALQEAVFALAGKQPE